MADIPPDADKSIPVRPNLPEFGPADDWQTWFLQLVYQLLLYAGENPWSFIYLVLLCLSPLFLISAVCAYKLAKQIEAQEKDKKKKARRAANISRTKRHGKAD